MKTASAREVPRASARGGGFATTALILWSLPSVALAQHWRGSIAATTDYVFRGISQTQGGPALQLDLHYEAAAGWFAGAWTSTIDFGYDSVGRVEVDPYVGWNLPLDTDWSTRLSYVRYLYPETEVGTDYDYGDFSVRLEWQDRAVASAAWSPDMVQFRNGYLHRGNAYSYELSLRQPLGSIFAGSIGAGYYDQLFGLEYWSWNAGVSCAVGRLELDLSRFANDGTAREFYGREAAGDRWALTALWRF